MKLLFLHCLLNYPPKTIRIDIRATVLIEYVAFASYRKNQFVARATLCLLYCLEKKVVNEMIRKKGQK